QALVAQGRLRTLTGTLAYDTRNDREEPTHGWWIRARSTVGLSGAAAIPGHVSPYAPGPEGSDPPSVSPVPAQDVDATFTAGFVDARRYNRVGPTSELVLRTVLGGSFTGDALPPQYQHALGGEGSLPGFQLFSLDCGARSATGGLALEGSATREEVFPLYGCDRMALFQAEFRWDVGWTLDLGTVGRGGGDEGETPSWGSGVELRPRWAAFLNAGRGWSDSLVGDPFTRSDESTQLDVGVGLTVRNLGLYLAQPLTGDGRRPNFFVRLDHRF
ncbi:MAG: BamA/TamA family outer membrane protein, partial [Thermoanaerobaculia bacterium]|nr:BamA/TamA family outer membrane protein [Thermoanaerobaculia bacterium]